MKTQTFGPLKIKSLKVFGNTWDSEMVSLLQNVSLHLENLELNIFIKKKAYESIINYCDKIKFFRLIWNSYDNTD